MKNSRIFKIYILTDGSHAYIGKSFDARIESVLWRHQRGENAHTQPYFSRHAAPNLRLKILTTVKGDHREAQRYVIAFIRYCLSSGYVVLNSPGMVKCALSLYPATDRLLSQLQLIPMHEWLRDSRPEDSSDFYDDEFPPVEPKKKRSRPTASETFSTRLYPEESALISRIMEEQNINQHQLMAVLLDTFQHSEKENPDWSCADYIGLFLNPLRSTVRQQKKELHDSKEKIRQLERQSEKQLRDREKLSRVGVSLFIHYFSPDKSKECLPTSGTYRDFLAFGEDAKEYTFPDNEDLFIFHPEEILYGSTRSHALFIIGTDDHGKKTILRFYPKEYYTGIFLTSKFYGRVESTWLVRAEQARDGAMDVVFSLPLSIAPKKETSEKMNSFEDIDSPISFAPEKDTCEKVYSHEDIDSLLAYATEKDTCEKVYSREDIDSPIAFAPEKDTCEKVYSHEDIDSLLAYATQKSRKYSGNN